MSTTIVIRQKRLTTRFVSGSEAFLVILSLNLVAFHNSFASRGTLCVCINERLIRKQFDP